jgi:hypothetical protein
MTEELEREAAESAYNQTAFDLESNPVGSRDWTIFWKAWQARAALSQREQEAPSLCTAEEAEELMKECTDYKVTDCCFSLSGRELAEIINADRAKR